MQKIKNFVRFSWKKNSRKTFTILLTRVKLYRGEKLENLITYFQYNL